MGESAQPCAVLLEDAVDDVAFEGELIFGRGSCDSADRLDGAGVAEDIDHDLAVLFEEAASEVMEGVFDEHQADHKTTAAEKEDRHAHVKELARGL